MDVALLERRAEEPKKPLGAWAQLRYCAANLGFGAFYALNNAALPLFLQRYTQDYRLLGLMGSTHSFEGALIQPLVGAASDRLKSPWGRRRPFMAAFVPVSALFLLLTPAAAHLPSAARLPVLIACIFLFTLAFNMAQDPYQALLPDITPPGQRSRVTSRWVLVNVIGQAGLMLLDLPLDLKFGLVAVLMLVTTAITCLGVSEPQAGPLPSRSPGAEMRHAFVGLRCLKQARKVLLTLFVSGLGVGALLPFLTVFAKTITGCTDHEAEQGFLILMAATALGVLPFGWLADRLGPKGVALAGLVLMAGAATAGLWVATLPQIYVAMAVAGLGNAAQSASVYPVLTRVVPSEEVGFYTGLQATALSVATPVTAVITGQLMRQQGIRVIFGVCAASMVVAMLLLATLRQTTAQIEIAARRAETGCPASEGARAQTP